eukprot:SAG25_NODE_1240_length_3521_cov_61.836061_4_plen_138_part_00
MRGLGRGVGLGAVIPETQYAQGLDCLQQAQHLALEDVLDTPLPCRLRCSSPLRRRNMPQGTGRTVDAERGGGGERQAIRGWRCALRPFLPSVGSDGDPTTRSQAAGSRACLQQKLSRCAFEPVLLHRSLHGFQWLPG